MAKYSLFVIIPLLKLLIFSSLRNLCHATASFYDFNLQYVPLDPATTGFTTTLNNYNANVYFGSSVSTAGDINNDGYDDIIIGAYGKDSFKGAAYVIYGGESSSLSSFDLHTTPLDPSTTGFIIIGDGFFGISVSTAGDINNDGYDDIIVGAPQSNSRTGAAYVIYGGEKSSMSNFDLRTTTLDPTTTGFTITRNDPNSLAYLGYSVSTAGDINNDGYDDIIIGARERREVYVIYGGEKSSMSNIDLSTTTLDPATTGFVVVGGSGSPVSAAGDINNDGYDDIILGAWGQYSWKGVVYVIYGGAKSLMSNLDLSTTILDPSKTGFTLTESATPTELGVSVNTAGDVNNDGYDDIIIGALRKNGYSGAAYVIYGGEKSSMSNIDLSNTPLDPTTTGFMIIGENSEDRLGTSVSRAGDLNKDGYNDIIVGAPYWGLSGAAYVIYGGKKSSMSNLDLSTTILDPTRTGFKIIGNPAWDKFGWSVSTAGDINKDGFKDIIIGSSSGYSNWGVANVIHTACSVCFNCPENCNQCSSTLSCFECMSPSVLYDSQCIDSCPAATFNSTSFCKGCPPFCSSCTSRQSCQACEPGYTLSNSLCVVPTLEVKAKAVQAVSSSAKAVGSVVCVGSATFPLTALVSKIVQNTRYLNLSVTDELAEIYKTWDSHMISWQVPSSFSRSDHFKASPSLFARYELGSPFLINFWPILMTIGVSWVVFIIFLVVRKIFERAEYKKSWIYSLLQKLVIGSFNFALVQTYGCLDDILFYLVIDIKTNPFGSFFSWASLICAFGFLMIGCRLVFSNFWTVKKYQSLKSQKNMKNLKTFNEKNKYWELFYSDFNDDDFWSQSFLPLIIIRSSLSSLIIAALYDVLLFQTTSLLILDGAVLLFLFSKNPFKKLRGKFAQYYFEAITLLVHICTFALSLERSSENLKAILSTAIIYLNSALVTGGTGFMFIEIYETINQMAKPGKHGHVAIQTSTQEEAENNTSSPDLMVSQIQNSKIEIQKRPSWVNSKHRKSNKGLGDFQRPDSNIVLAEMDTSDLIGGKRDQSSSPIISVIQNVTVTET